MKKPEEKKLSLTEFSPCDSQTWKAQILQDIRKATAEEKEAVYEEKMRWRSYEGITMEPFYTQEDLLNLPAASLPAASRSWQNRQYIPVEDAKEANVKALEAISGGTDSVLLDVSQLSAIHLPQLLQNIKLSAIPVSFQVRNFSVEFLSQLHQIAPYHWKGSLFYDPLADHLLGQEVPLETAFNSLAEALSFTNSHPLFRSLTISSHHLHEAGASAVQELAFLLSTFVEYTHQLSERGIAITDIFSSTELSVSVSTNYFVEIAKLRALHLLWQQLSNSYQIESSPAYIHARTALWNKPEADVYNNMIRATIETMAAALGGSASITVLPYNNNQSDMLAARMARNVSIILKEESYFDKVLNIASGAYYIEKLTHQLATEAWALFQTTEANGGFLQAVKEGFIQDQITTVRKAKEADILSGKQVIVGLNKYTPKGITQPGSVVFSEPIFTELKN